MDPTILALNPKIWTGFEPTVVEFSTLVLPNQGRGKLSPWVMDLNSRGFICPEILVLATMEMLPHQILNFQFNIANIDWWSNVGIACE